MVFTALFYFIRCFCMPEYFFTHRSFWPILIIHQFSRPFISLLFGSGAHLYFNIQSLSKFFFNSPLLTPVFHLPIRFYVCLFNYQSICTHLFSVFLSEFTPVFFLFFFLYQSNFMPVLFFLPMGLALVFLYLYFSAFFFHFSLVLRPFYLYRSVTVSVFFVRYS